MSVSTRDPDGERMPADCLIDFGNKWLPKPRLKTQVTFRERDFLRRGSSLYRDTESIIQQEQYVDLGPADSGFESCHRRSPVKGALRLKRLAGGGRASVIAVLVFGMT